MANVGVCGLCVLLMGGALSWLARARGCRVGSRGVTYAGTAARNARTALASPLLGVAMLR